MSDDLYKRRLWFPIYPNIIFLFRKMPRTIEKLGGKSWDVSPALERFLDTLIGGLWDIGKSEETDQNRERCSKERKKKFRTFTLSCQSGETNFSFDQIIFTRSRLTVLENFAHVCQSVFVIYAQASRVTAKIKNFFLSFFLRDKNLTSHMRSDGQAQKRKICHSNNMTVQVFPLLNVLLFFLSFGPSAVRRGDDEVGFSEFGFGFNSFIRRTDKANLEINIKSFFHCTQFFPTYWKCSKMQTFPEKVRFSFAIFSHWRVPRKARDIIPCHVFPASAANSL